MFRCRVFGWFSDEWYEAPAIRRYAKSLGKDGHIVVADMTGVNHHLGSTKETDWFPTVETVDGCSIERAPVERHVVSPMILERLGGHFRWLYRDWTDISRMVSFRRHDVRSLQKG